MRWLTKVSTQSCSRVPDSIHLRKNRASLSVPSIITQLKFKNYISLTSCLETRGLGCRSKHTNRDRCISTWIWAVASTARSYKRWTPLSQSISRTWKRATWATLLRIRRSRTLPRTRKTRPKAVSTTCLIRSFRWNAKLKETMGVSASRSTAVEKKLETRSLS